MSSGREQAGAVRGSEGLGQAPGARDRVRY